ncbi:T-cell surface glycoprotein CD3 delta chain isoform 2-T2 [Trichechus inunguis]
MKHSRFLVGLVLAALILQESYNKITVEEHEDKVILKCDGNISWIEGTEGNPLSDNKSLVLGKSIQDPQGMYECTEEGAVFALQVYYRMCQNCVELDSTTLVGIVITDIIATLLLALGVYCFAGHETGRLSRAADTQALLRNDQLYQPLRDRNDGQYSHLGGNWPRNK